MLPPVQTSTGGEFAMRKARALRLVSIGVAWILAGSAPVLAQMQPPASKTEPGGWNQGRVTAIAEKLAAEFAELQIQASQHPPDISFSQQRAQYELEEDIRLLKNTSQHLATQLKAGKNREETRPIFKRMETLRADAEENARKTVVTEHLLDQILEAGGVLLQLQPYYREAEPSGGSGS
jgi:hypothetical protein